MAYLFAGLLNWLRSLFFAKHLEVTIVGLQVRWYLCHIFIADTKTGERQDLVSPRMWTDLYLAHTMLTTCAAWSMSLALINGLRMSFRQ